MNVYLTFDIEVWCDGWNDLDGVFPGNFARYVYGRSSYGSYALPKTLEILDRQGLKGVFFVEPLFAARFGLRYLAEIVALIKDAGQDVQLHLHPEWTDEISPHPIPNVVAKRQHLSYYDLAEQTALIAFGKQLLDAAGGGVATAFRAGSYAANADTFVALGHNGLALDSSLNNCYAISGSDVERDLLSNAPLSMGTVLSYPVSIFRDGMRRLRPAHVAGAGFSELRLAMLDAKRMGQTDFVIVSHNFEMLKPRSSQPDWTVVRRFEKLCAFLGAHADAFRVRTFAYKKPASDKPAPFPACTFNATVQRHVEQLWRRM
jgi:hypothetical protein